ncbi:hypothetical protein RintRC_0229 [Richelia intracellularis]|nr:hypothetical protein RintRC_0229 [Richelia intracellularis]
MTAVGSLKQANIRFANQQQGTIITDKFEIIALSGTLANTGLHLHIAIRERYGKVIAGHLNPGCIIYTTAEIIIGTIEDFQFIRAIDKKTGYLELDILPQNTG